jgi:hypothetical protein
VNHAKYSVSDEHDFSAAACPAELVTPVNVLSQDTLVAGAAGDVSVKSYNSCSSCPASDDGSQAPDSDATSVISHSTANSDSMIAESTDELLFLDTPRSRLLRVPARLSYGDRMSRPLSVLIDIGFTGYALVSSKVAAELGGGSRTQDLPVRLADGTIVNSTHILADAMLFVGSKRKRHKEIASVRVFPLH